MMRPSPEQAATGPGVAARPPLSAAHGTSLGTTAGITAVICVVVAIGLLGHCGAYRGWLADLAACALVALLLGALALYLGRNEIGRALDLAATDAGASGVAAARGLARFHLGMAGLFAGCGLAGAVRFHSMSSPLGWLVAALGAVITAMALARAWTWAGEARVRARALRAP